MVNHFDFGARGAGQISDCGSGQTANPEKRLYFSVLQGIRRFSHAQALAADVFQGVKASSFHQAKGHDFRGAARAAGRQPLALQIGHGFDAGGLEGDHVHAVGVEHQQCLDIDFSVGEFFLSLGRIKRGVDHGESDIGLAAAHQVEVVDRAACYLCGGLHAGHMLGQDIGQATPHRVIHAPCAAGGDRNILGKHSPGGGKAQGTKQIDQAHKNLREDSETSSQASQALRRFSIGIDPSTPPGSQGKPFAVSA